MLPGDFLEAVTHDLRELLRLLNERNHRPTATIFDGRTRRSSPESGGRAGDDGYKRNAATPDGCIHSGSPAPGRRAGRRIRPLRKKCRPSFGLPFRNVDAVLRRRCMTALWKSVRSPVRSHLPWRR